MSKKHTTARKAAHFKSTNGSNRSLTVYNNGLGIVQETREVKLAAGANEVQLEGMPRAYQPSTLKVLSVSGAGELTLTGSTHQDANLNTAKLLSMLEGTEVEIHFRSVSGRQRSTRGTLQHFLGDKLVLTKDDGRSALITVADVEDVTFAAKFPAELSKTANLVMSASATEGGAQSVRILFHTGGLSWQAHHSAIYDEKKSELNGFETWAEVRNSSGASFDDARLTLFAGDIAGGQEAAFGGARVAAAAAPMGGRAKMADAMSESIGEHKLYEVPGRFNIGDGQTKPVPVYSAPGAVPVRREFFVPAQNQWQRGQEEGLKAVSIRLRLTNDKEHSLGSPLPAGDVKIYQLDSHGDAQLTGLASIDHVAAGETFGFILGSSTDIKAERKLIEQEEGTTAQPEFPIKPLGGPGVGESGGAANKVRRSALKRDEGKDAPKFRDETWEVTVHNFKSEGSVDVVVMEEFQGKHEILECTHQFRKERASRYAASVSVAAGQKATLRYKVRFTQE